MNDMFKLGVRAAIDAINRGHQDASVGEEFLAGRMDTIYCLESLLKGTSPTVPWDQIDDSIVAVARRKDGWSYGHTEVPVLSETMEQWVNGHAIPMKYFKDFDPGTCDWRCSLVLRPTGE